MVLKELMCDESVSTTEKYDVDPDADATAAMLAGLMPLQTLRVCQRSSRMKKPRHNRGLKEARAGFEPAHDGFAIRCLSHLATAPLCQLSPHQTFRQIRHSSEAVAFGIDRLILGGISAFHPAC